MRSWSPTAAAWQARLAEIEIEQEIRRRARESVGVVDIEDEGPEFGDWLREVTPSWRWDWRHLEFMRLHLDRVTSGECRKLMVFIPPRHGKSEQNTIRYPVWRLTRDPSLKIIIGAYNQTLANKFSRKARRLAMGRVILSDDRTAVEDWETAAGGGIRAVGVGSGITGQGGDLILIDDPVKSREEAESLAYRERCWDWYTDDLYSRLEPGAAMVLTMTRWHDDDLAGRILDSEDGPNWDVIRLPALAEAGDPLGREPGEALCPDRYGEDDLESIRTVQGSYGFASLYQQSPMPPGGGMFRRESFAGRILDAKPGGLSCVRYWDKAGTEGGGAYSCGVLMGRAADGTFCILDVVRGQWSAGQREAIIRDTAAADGRGVPIWVEQEPGSGGKESAENTIRNLAGWAAHAERVTGDKETRARPFAAQCEAGNVRLIKAPWNRPFLDEAVSFPNGRYKDQIDAAAGAFNKLAMPEPVVSKAPRPARDWLAGYRG